MVRRLLESLGFGASVAFLFGAGDVRLHHDLAAAMPALALDQIRSFVPAGLGLGAALGALAAFAPLALERGRSLSGRLVAGTGTAVAAVGLWRASASFGHAAWSRPHWNRPTPAVPVLGAAAVLALAAVGLAAVVGVGVRRVRLFERLLERAGDAAVGGVLHALP